MKKLVLFLLVLIFISGCSTNNLSNKDSSNKIDDTPIIEEEKKEEYVDNNPIKLGFYELNSNSSTLKLLTSYESKWQQYKDMAWFGVYPTNESTITNGRTKEIWKKYWADYENQNYKFGVELSYSLDDGQDIRKTLLKYSDNDDYVKLYFYDGYNATTSWYTHLEDDDFTDRTVFTSIKVFGDYYIDKLVSPVILKVFTYDGLDDFDENGYYRGNSYATITINKKN